MKNKYFGIVARAFGIVVIDALILRELIQQNDEVRFLIQVIYTFLSLIIGKY